MKKPFIQLFRTPRAYYFFDANTTEILQISKESFFFLENCLAGTADINATNLDEILLLRKKGYLSTESVVKEIRHPASSIISDLLERKLSHITLQITQNCNLRCKYCVYSEKKHKEQRSHSNKKMDWEAAKKSIDFLYAHSVDSNSVTVGFYGGEPLLEMPLIKRIVSYSKELFDGKKLSFAITTNGTLLSDEIILYLAAEQFQTTISLDGPKEIHDKNRVFKSGGGSFDTIMRNLARIKEIAIDYYHTLRFSMVMDPANDFDCINEISFSLEDYQKNKFFSTIVEKDPAERDKIGSSDGFFSKYEYQKFLALLSGIGRFPRDGITAVSFMDLVSFLNDIDRFDMFGPLHSTDVPSGPCITGQLRPLINSQGYIFPCERVSETSLAMNIGNIESGFDIEKVLKLLNIGALTKENCRNCWGFRFCSLCAKKADAGVNDLSPERKLSNCEIVRRSAYERVRQLIMANEVGMYYST